MTNELERRIAKLEAIEGRRYEWRLLILDLDESKESSEAKVQSDRRATAYQGNYLLIRFVSAATPPACAERLATFSA